MSLFFDLSNVDTSYDDIFSGELHLRWMPWVGVTFTQTPIRTMILGESTYNWEQENGSDYEKVENRINKSDHLRILHQNHALNYTRNSSFVRNIERAIFLKKNPLLEQKQWLWSSVVYHNLVQRHMPTIADRPKYSDYITGWMTFVELAKLMELDQCIVYGLEYNKLCSLADVLNDSNVYFTHIKAKNKVGRSYPRIVNIKLNSKTVKLIFIRHPSSYFSWEKWGQVLKNELELPDTA